MQTTGVYPQPRNAAETCIFETAASYECEAIMEVTEENMQEYIDSLKAADYHIASYGKDVDPFEPETELGSCFIAFDWMGEPPADV